ncbi:MAG: hypothetical protein OXF50_16890 [Caldilineaceae bacterium]|nr:hypothetical protein [Caldilineaceae bacterium]
MKNTVYNLVDGVVSIALVLGLIAYLESYLGWGENITQIIIWSFIGYRVAYQSVILKIIDRFLTGLSDEEQAPEEEEDDEGKPYDWSEFKELIGTVFAAMFLSFAAESAFGGLGETVATAILVLYAGKKVLLPLGEVIQRDRGAYRKYKESTEERRGIIDQLRNETSEWGQIADVLNEKGYRYKRGEKFYDKLVRDEHTILLLNRIDDDKSEATE